MTCDDDGVQPFGVELQDIMASWACMAAAPLETLCRRCRSAAPHPAPPAWTAPHRIARRLCGPRSFSSPPPSRPITPAAAERRAAVTRRRHKSFSRTLHFLQHLVCDATFRNTTVGARCNSRARWGCPFVMHAVYKWQQQRDSFKISLVYTYGPLRGAPENEGVGWRWLSRPGELISEREGEGPRQFGAPSAAGG